MHVVIWEFVVPDATRAEFERVYGPHESGGEWAALFRRAAGYVGTELLRDAGTGGEAGRYLTVDRWESAAAYAAFKQDFAEDYAELDRSCERLTESERRIGAFEVR